ncbi:hypothetical protein ACOBV8_21675 (plasmid) [Pseudoalteromonas espejiana]
MLAIAPWPSSPTNAGENAPLQASITDTQAWDIISKHCTQCHSETPTSELFKQRRLALSSTLLMM